MITSEIRRIFYAFFSKQNHHKVLSAPLIPAKDPTLLFTNAGMNQFKSVFLQEEKREYSRAVSIQKCMRVSGKHNDFDEVGKTDFHHTFFEMLGNFSFGNYFKEKAIEFAWDLLVNHYNFSPDKLWVSVYKEDDEAYKIWKKNIGIPEKKIARLGKKDNFWQMGDIGPCGPCSEIYFDRGDTYGPDRFSEDNKRYIEIWNLVFMQFNRDKEGNLNPLPAPSIDTGMGLERLATCLQEVKSNYDTDLFQPLIKTIADQAGISPGNQNHKINLNVIADHIRALTFLVADGILPANDGRGYVLRRILRRAAKHGKSLGFTEPFLYQISESVIETMKDFYPELEFNQTFISEVIQAEEDRFNRTLANGLKRFEVLLETALDSEDKIIPGRDLFKLSDTYGFPIDFAIDLAKEKDLLIDHSGFQKELAKQQEKSRSHFKENFHHHNNQLAGIDKYQTAFTGYDSLEEEASLQAIFINNQKKTEINAGGTGIFILNKTPFYAESGGQVGDSGTGKSSAGYFDIIKTTKGNANEIIHHIFIKKGTLQTGDKIRVQVDKPKRTNIAIHHTATHLLHYALREVLGLHVKQAGSYVGPDKLRFDFTHFKAVSNEELHRIEIIINQKIRNNIYLNVDTLKYEEAINKGAIAIFTEKYSDLIRMVSIGNFSLELCGGTHLNSTGEIGTFKISNESSISSGIRRIEAIAGEMALKKLQEDSKILTEIHNYFKQKPQGLLAYLKDLEKNLKEKERVLKKNTEMENRIDVNSLVKRRKSINDIFIIVEFIANHDKKKLSTLSDELKDKTGGVVVLATNEGDKSAIVTSIAKDFTKILNAGIIVKEIAKMVKGNGGGRPDFAQAGGEMIADQEVFKNQTLKIIGQFIK